MSMFGRVIMVGNLACYNQVQVIAINVVVVVVTMTMAMPMMMKTIPTFRKQLLSLPWTWPSS